MTDTNVAAVDVLICTYRRPALLLKTLAGIERCAAALGARVRAVVVDNDDQQSARDTVLHWAQDAGIAVTYLSQPVQNIALTRNMALDSATAPWIALIDDDEVPDTGWLTSLLDTARQFDADVVFAPVIAEFDSDAPTWATQGTIFQRRRFATGTVIPLKEARTGNVLLRTARLAQDAFRFDPALGLSGGEDSEFFSRLSRAQYRMVWCDEACVREWTPPSRTTLSWVLKRGFRVGSVEAYNRRRKGELRATGTATLKFFIIFLQGLALTALWALGSRPRCARAMSRAALGAGFFYGLVNGPYREYRSAGTQQGATS